MIHVRGMSCSLKSFSNAATHLSSQAGLLVAPCSLFSLAVSFGSSGLSSNILLLLKHKRRLLIYSQLFVMSFANGNVRVAVSLLMADTWAPGISFTGNIYL